MKTVEYEFNQSGVCTNPTVVFLETKKPYTGTVRVFRAPNGLWGNGVHWDVPNSGQSTPPAIRWAKYKTMHEATTEGIQEIQAAWKKHKAESKAEGEEGNGQMTLF